MFFSSHDKTDFLSAANILEQVAATLREADTANTKTLTGELAPFKKLTELPRLHVVTLYEPYESLSSTKNHYEAQLQLLNASLDNARKVHESNLDAIEFNKAFRERFEKFMLSLGFRKDVYVTTRSKRGKVTSGYVTAGWIESLNHSVVINDGISVVENSYKSALGTLNSWKNKRVEKFREARKEYIKKQTEPEITYLIQYVSENYGHEAWNLYGLVLYFEDNYPGLREQVFDDIDSKVVELYKRIKAIESKLKELTNKAEKDFEWA